MVSPEHLDDPNLSPFISIQHSLEFDISDTESIPETCSTSNAPVTPLFVNQKKNVTVVWTYSVSYDVSIIGTTFLPCELLMFQSLFFRILAKPN